MKCELCQKQIKTPIHIEINAITIRHNESFVGSYNFSLEDKKDLVTTIIAHKACWKKLLEVKKGKKVEVVDGVG